MYVRAMLRALAVLLFVAAGALALQGCNASCAAMDVRGVSAQCSGGAKGYMWTGTGCIYTRACNCTGADCQRLYSTQDACETAHIHCSAR